MFRLHDKHPIFNRSVLWSVFLFSLTFFVSWVLSESLPNPFRAKTSSSTPSPQTTIFPPPSPTPLLAEQQRDQIIATNQVSQQQTSNRTTQKPSSNVTDPKTETKTPPSKFNQTETKTPPVQSTDPKTNTLNSSQSTAKTQTSESSKSNKDKVKASQPSHATPVIEMRVAIADGENSLVVATSTPAQVLNASGKALGKLPANEATNIVPNGSNIRISQWETSGGVWVKPTKGGFVFVGKHWYRGDVMLLSQGETLLAVNYIDLESYITSVVGSEVPASWPMDALKAQAIAARSYALVHYLRPAHALYHLGNTQRWQVYQGLNSEWNTSRQAAEETKGVFLSYNNGIVESMYAANDEIISNVHGGRGMSQNGAFSMAQQGYTYQQILSWYYPGTSLAGINATSNTN